MIRFNFNFFNYWNPQKNHEILTRKNTNTYKTKNIIGFMSFNKSQQEKLEKSGYRFVGKHGHAAAKICHWTRQSILDKGVC